MAVLATMNKGWVWNLSTKWTVWWSQNEGFIKHKFQQSSSSNDNKFHKHLLVYS
jgi:hypothetical protein